MQRVAALCLSTTFLLGISAPTGFADEPPDGDRLNLGGSWRAALDDDDQGTDERWFTRTLPGKAEARLPGALRESGLGEPPSPETEWIGSIKFDEWAEPRYAPFRTDDHFKMPFWLQPNRHYVGPAWFQREVEVPDDWQRKRITLHLERPHWHTTLWIDDRHIGTCDSLSTPHVYDVTDALAPGNHRVTIRVDNSLEPLNVGPNSHSVSDHTQSAWNGITGAVELRATPPVWLENVQVYPQVTEDAARVVIETGNQTGRPAQATLTLQVKGVPAAEAPAGMVEKTVKIDVPDGGGKHTVEVKLGEPVLLWDEFGPDLYRLSTALETSHGRHRREETFGMREVTTEGTQIVLNGRPIFLRGTLECCIFPLTGYPPTDVEAWRRVIRVCQSYGLNHMRFHSWCPPEAAFEAADELGFYFQVECSTWPNSGSSVGNGGPMDDWLYREADRILAAYGNHPSFLLLASGNEPAGPERGAKFLRPWVSHFQQKDSRRLVTSASGWPTIDESDYHVTPQPRIQGWGQELRSRINAEPPATLSDYREFVARYPRQPVVAHEIGQWCVYPNFDEMAKYTGTLYPRNFEVFRDFLEAAHMLDQARDFLMASGKLQTLCYKEEIESALRTPGFGGFQLLDLHDFPGQGTALVGVADPFWDPKPYVAPAEYARFCNATVPLARLPKRVYTSDETLTATLELSHFGPQDLKDIAVRWQLTDESGNEIAADRFTAGVIPTGKLSRLREIEVSLAGTPAPARLKLTAALEDRDIQNAWDVWVYPSEISTEPPEGVHVARALDDETLGILENGGRVLLLLHPDRVKTDVELGFSSIFWNTAWTGDQAPHTLGILCDPDHPALAGFPTEYHTNWQWWDLIHSAATMELDHLPPEVRPLVQVVPDWFDPKRLALAFEARVAGGSLLVCSMDLQSDLSDRPVAQQMRRSLFDYIASDDFEPQWTVEVDQVRSLLREPSLFERFGAKATADSHETGYEPELAIDGHPETMWHTAWTPSEAPLPHALTIALDEPVMLAGIRVLPRQDGNPNGQIAEYTVSVSTGGDDWSPVAEGTWTRGRAPKEVRFSQPVTCRLLKLESRSEVKGKPFASVAEVELILSDSPNLQ